MGDGSRPVAAPMAMLSIARDAISREWLKLLLLLLVVELLLALSTRTRVAIDADVGCGCGDGVWRAASTSTSAYGRPLAICSCGAWPMGRYSPGCCGNSAYLACAWACACAWCCCICRWNACG